MKNKWYKILYFRDGRIFLFLALLSLIITSFLGFLIPLYVKKLASFYKTNLFVDQLYSLGIVFICVYLTRIFYGLSIMKYTTLLMQSIRTTVYSKWLNFSETIIEGNPKQKEYPQGEIMSRIMSDTEALRDMVTSGTLNILMELVLVISCFISFMNISFKLGVILAFLEILVVVIFLIGSNKMRVAFLRVRQTRGRLSHTVANSMGGIGELYFNIHDNYILKKCRIIFKKYLKDMVSSIWWDASYYSFSESIVPIFLVAIVFLIPYAHITEAALILTIVDLIQRSIRPIKSIASQIGNVQRAYGGIYRVNQIIEDFDSRDLSDCDIVINKVNKIHLLINSFQYPNNANNLKRNNHFKITSIDLNLFIGKRYAFVGLSGCGKSTILNILAGSIVPKDYIVEINDKPIAVHKDETLDWYRRHVGLISQDSHVFSNTLYFNLSFKNVLTDELKFFWSKVIIEVPYLNEWGITLDSEINVDDMSLGQKQLIAALRSLFLKKEIVLLDEISSSLDSKLEHSLSEIVSLISKESITIFVAHRIETILSCDRIFVMENGNIIQEGRHKELEKESQLYQDFLNELSTSKL